jgi:prolyl oligopeptidase
MEYPVTRKDNVVEEHFGIKVSDPYRWLEDDNSPDTIGWINQQQSLTEQVLNEYPDRADFLARMQELCNYPRQSCPVRYGDWYYYAKNAGLQNQWVTYRRKVLHGEEELFFDPNTLSEDGTTTADSVGHSPDFRYFVYMISKSGSDAGEFWIMDTETKTWLADKLYDLRHSGAAWYKDGFFYSRYDGRQDYQQQDKNQKICYHKLGEPMEKDTLVYEDPEHPLRFNYPRVLDDSKILFIISGQGTSGNSIMFKSLEDEAAEFQCLFEGFDYNGYLQESFIDGFVYLFTNKNAKNFRLLKVDLAHPEEQNWVEIIPERDYVLENVTPADGKLIAIFIKDVQSKIEVLDKDGKFLYDIELPYQGTAYFGIGKKEYKEGFFGFSSYVKPDEIYHYNIAENRLSFYYRDPVKADVQDLVSEQIFYTSKDGTAIPMTLLYKKGIKKDSNLPVLLYGYGGFNIALMPYFSTSRIALLEKGFVMAIANLRGGGEYGEKWHEAGMLLNKQNVFDDFISAAEYLIKEGYTNPAKLAIMGGSNGGLLIGACINQRPDLFKAAVCMMGVLDMLRFHKFTCGWGWMVEYGNPDEEAHFNNLIKYSPLHNIKPGVRYPATMITTADHDDRVVPGHSFKFAAALQEQADNANPVLIYTQFKSSHGPSSLTNSLKLFADSYSFICKYLDVQ